ncbi:NAD(P)-binding protein [Fomitopsis serialis]|uniref:NAD(P)-binding protein n=1 Tax=Fomitopsis serialis TaxID=139415 RepID=UPI002007C33B|nr:NAD(P)-binding protein [Neoantrodia serialis]KAH9913918.1 NAD(P)-binding protein [Neoantrodia serialis]
MAGLWSTLRYSRRIHRQCRPPEPTFSTDDIPDLTGKVMIVTGGNAGIGKETVKVLLSHNATVYMASRDETRAHAAIDELKEQTGREAIYLELNLANLASVRRAAAEFLSKEKELHALFNNAGVSTIPMDWLTDDGYDMTFGTNVIGHFLFTKLLLPTLLAGRDSSPDHFARVIWLSSYASYLSSLHYATFKEGPARRKAGYARMYFQSKFANVVLAHECARRYGAQGILSLSVNPGNIKTDIMKYASAVDLKFVDIFIKLYPVEYGALGQLWAGTMPEALQYNGEFVVPWAKVDARPRQDAFSEKVGSKLWSWLENEVEI